VHFRNSPFSRKSLDAAAASGANITRLSFEGSPFYETFFLTRFLFLNGTDNHPEGDDSDQSR